MAQIRQLEPHVADLIAAGEVVERPASVVKELVENAIDAGSSAVVVETRRGGMGLIRATDNGCGMDAAEVPTAFLRHATSKLRGPEDLGKIGTLGFRGEALAAISAVSRVDILTRRKGQETGASLHLEGGIPGAVEAAGAPEGTTITVRDLFYNTPARLKFMKKDSAETAAVNGLMQHLALSHPNVSFRYIKDGVEALHTPGDGKLESAVYAALGRDFARSLLPVEGRGGDVAVSGFVTEPLQCRGSRSMQILFVNGRFIKSQLLTAALEEGYRNQLMKGRFPGCVLSVTMPVTAVDVNVHPAKTQVKFAREKEVFDAVYHTVLDCLAERAGAVGKAAPPPLTENPRQDFFQSMDAKTFRAQTAGKSSGGSGDGPAGGFYRQTILPLRQNPGGVRAFRSAFPPERTLSGRAADGPEPPEDVKFPDWRNFPQEAGPPDGVGFPAEGAALSPALGEPPASVSGRASAGAAGASASGTPPDSAVPRDFPPAIPCGAPEQETLEPVREAPWRVAGEILRTYIICEDEAENLWLIDKHAAHERINFDRLKAAQEPPMRQTLLTPAVIEPGQEDAALLLENLPVLEDFGFACEDFGGGAILVREVPADIDAADASSALEELAGALRTGRSPEERREAILHTMACKAAIKGGWKTDPAELQVLVRRVQSGEVRFCPHGRPVAVKLTKYDLEKMFKRA